MLPILKRFVKHSVVYSVGNIATKAIGVILLPLYTHFIPLAGYGTLAIIEVSLFVGVELLTFGQTQALLVFSASSSETRKKGSVFFTIFLFLFTVSVVVLFPLAAAFNTVSSHYLPLKEYEPYFVPGLIIIFFRILVSLGLTKLRSDEKSIHYMLVSLIKLTRSRRLGVFI